MSDMKSFSKQIRLTAKTVEQNVDRLVRKVALAVDTAVVMGTPVDTGRARANWQVSVGDAPDGVLFPEPEKPPSPEAGAQRSLDEAQQKVAEYKGRGIIHVTNNLHYIEKLNAGSSAQAPAGYVEQAAIAASETIATAEDLTVEVVEGD